MYSDNNGKISKDSTPEALLNQVYRAVPFPNRKRDKLALILV